jgi:hypothetical protein
VRQQISQCTFPAKFMDRITSKEDNNPRPLCRRYWKPIKWMQNNGGGRAQHAMQPDIATSRLPMDIRQPSLAAAFDSAGPVVSLPSCFGENF